MNRLFQTDPDIATGQTKQLLDDTRHKLGFVPNFVRVIANSKAALEGYLALGGALAHGTLSLQLREQIALTVAEINGSGYCLSAHSLIGDQAGLCREDIRGARRALAPGGKADAVLKLARAIALQRGNISDAELYAARCGGLSDAEIVEVIHHVGLNVLTNYTNNVARTIVDFPEVRPGEIEPGPLPSATLAPAGGD